MKTLDEVIKAFDNNCAKCGECPYCEDKYCRDELDNDALHYLKTYKENQYAYEEGNRKAEEARERYMEAVKNCELAENKYKRLCKETSQNLRNTSQITCPKCHSEFVILPDANNPLSWDELRTMEGKPVWVEELGRKYATPYWAIHHGIMDGYDGDENLYLEPFEVLTKYTLGKTWQAYRKERE